MFSNVHDILRATVQLSFSCTLYPNILFRASAVAFPVDGLVCLWSVDSSVGLAIFSCDWALLLLSCSLFSVVQLCYLLCFNIRWGTANLMVDLKYYVTNNTLATLTLPSLLVRVRWSSQFSTILLVRTSLFGIYLLQTLFLLLQLVVISNLSVISLVD